MGAASKVTDAPRLDGQRLDAISRRLEQDVAATAIPGATVVIGSRDQVLFKRAVGFRDVTTHDPLQLDAIWRIYSMTKPLVTAAAMSFVEGEVRANRKPCPAGP
jgi:CubicO group peptidase (beta-lactamase class C family)